MIIMKKITCEFTIEQLQLIYYLLEKEKKNTEKYLSNSITDKSSDLSSVEDLLSKKSSLEGLKSIIKKYYGGINA